MKELRIIHATDGSFAICDCTEVKPGVRIWSPVSPERWDTELRAKIALVHYKAGLPAPKQAKPKQAPQPEPAPAPKPSIPKLPREDFRVVKLAPGAFAVEMKRFGEWERIATKKTATKAEEYIIKCSYGD